MHPQLCKWNVCECEGEDTEGGGYHKRSEMNGVSVFLGKLLAPEHTVDGQTLLGMPKWKKQDGGREEKITGPGQNERHNAASTQEQRQKRAGHCTDLLA